MIVLDFIVDEEELAEDLEFDIPTTDLDLFVLTFFIMPVRLNINGVELFRFDSSEPWDCRVGIPILNIASNGLIAIKSLHNSKKENYMFPEVGGVLHMTMLPENMVSLSFKKNMNFIVPYEELLKAFEDFAASVRKFFNERVPQMLEHPYWGPWLKGERD